MIFLARPLVLKSANSDLLHNAIHGRKSKDNGFLEACRLNTQLIRRHGRGGPYVLPLPLGTVSESYWSIVGDAGRTDGFRCRVWGNSKAFYKARIRIRSYINLYVMW